MQRRRLSPSEYPDEETQVAGRQQHGRRRGTVPHVMSARGGITPYQLLAIKNPLFDMRYLGRQRTRPSGSSPVGYHHDGGTTGRNLHLSRRVVERCANSHTVPNRAQIVIGSCSANYRGIRCDLPSLIPSATRRRGTDCWRRFPVQTSSGS
jgi:hypothetical protein